jgi:hypothetical protein
LHYYRFYKSACLLFILSVVSATRSFYWSTLRVQPSLIPTDHLSISDMVLITLSSLSPLFEEELDYRLGALEKWLWKCFPENELFENLGMG